MTDKISTLDRDRVRQALSASLAPSTRRAYLGHWRAFEAWAAARGYAASPAAPRTVAAHLAQLADSASVSTLRVRRAAIGAAHRAMGHPDPAASELVKRALGGLVRQLGSAQAQAAPLDAAALDAIRATACLPRAGGQLRRRRESVETARRRGLADIALCSVMRDALLRREEAASLAWGDIAEEADGSGRLAVRRAKNDQEANGTLLYLGPQAMRDLAAIRLPGADPAGRVFRLSGSQVSRRIAAAARAAGLGEGFSGHSPRIGMAQDLAASGAGLPELMQAGRWKSSAMPALYIRSQAAGRGAVAKYYAQKKDSE
ncbi:MAG: tyrosine-type recombinase/integrase [Alphaproteobacteria bacterium]|nr:tyrosine-type recombinase/integrase [Alphaproteobacteria bacterium]